MTEDEARLKWCPMVRNHDRNLEQSSVCNRYRGEVEPEHKCIASDCMMWETWRYFETEDGRRFSQKVKDGGEWKEGGDCGLKRIDLGA